MFWNLEVSGEVFVVRIIRVFFEIKLMLEVRMLNFINGGRGFYLRLYFIG